MMIRLEQGDTVFNYRVVGVAIHNKRVLLHRAEHDSFWALPGGRAELLETARPKRQPPVGNGRLRARNPHVGLPNELSDFIQWRCSGNEESCRA